MRRAAVAGGMRNKIFRGFSIYAPEIPRILVHPRTRAPAYGAGVTYAGTAWFAYAVGGPRSGHYRDLGLNRAWIPAMVSAAT